MAQISYELCARPSLSTRPGSQLSSPVARVSYVRLVIGSEVRLGGFALICAAAAVARDAMNDYEYVVLDTDDIHEYLMDENKWQQMPWEDLM